MTVFITYAGRRVALDPRYTDGNIVENAITETMNRARRYRDDFDERPLGFTEGVSVGWIPWVGFGLDGGGTISFPVHDGMQILVEDTDGTDYDLPTRTQNT